jgi:2-methylcitrate dehydratase PrpD
LAALSNGTAAHSPELDDTENFGAIHLTTTVVPAALAVAEARRASGAALMTAVVGGCEVAMRLAIAGQENRGMYHRGFHPTAVCGAFGAAAAAGIVMDLDTEALAEAFGVAGSSAAGLLAFLNDGSWTKRYGAGHAAENGVVAATLASLGFTGPREIFVGRSTFLPAYSTDPAPEKLLEGLGETYAVLQTGIKPHACCRYNQSPIDCAVRLHAQRPLTADAIKAVRVGLMRSAIDLLAEPHARRIKPETVVDAQFSVQYSVASALLRGRAFIDEFSPEAIQDPDVLAVARQVELVHDAALEKDYPKLWPAWVEVDLGDGARLRATVPTCKGDPANPLTASELEAKFRTLAGRVLPADSVASLLGALRRVDRMHDVNELSQHLAYGLAVPAAVAYR